MRKQMWVGAVTVLVAGPAAAFYFPGWPADGLPRPSTLYASSVGGVDVQTDVTVYRPPGAVLAPPPRTVPEPATLALAAVGLAAVVFRRVR